MNKSNLPSQDEIAEDEKEDHTEDGDFAVYDSNVIGTLRRCEMYEDAWLYLPWHSKSPLELLQRVFG